MIPRTVGPSFGYAVFNVVRTKPNDENHLPGQVLGVFHNPELKNEEDLVGFELSFAPLGKVNGAFVDPRLETPVDAELVENPFELAKKMPSPYVKQGLEAMHGIENALNQDVTSTSDDGELGPFLDDLENLISQYRKQEE